MTSIHEEIKAGRLRTVRLGVKHIVPKVFGDQWLLSLPTSPAA